MQMRLKKLGLVIAAVGALAGILASSALGAAVTESASWWTGNPTVTLAQKTDLPVNLKSGEHLLPDGTTSTKSTFIVTVEGTKYHLTATGVECVGCNITNGELASEKAMAKGRIRFTGVTVMEPAGCSVNKGEVLTNELIAHADYMHEKKAYVAFEPKEGPLKAFATVEVVGCALETNLIVKGTVFGEALNNTGTPAKEQSVTFSQAIHKTTGSTTNVNGNTAFLEGRGIASLASGAEFGVK